MKKRIIALAILSAFSVSAYAASEALVVQDGSLNNAQVTQTDNITPTYASVHQTGTSNQADVSQEQGNDTTALVNSIGNHPAERQPEQRPHRAGRDAAAVRGPQRGCHRARG